jgi:hypothetical protein
VTTILFSGETGSAQIVLEKSAELKIVGAALSVGGPLLASYQNGAWHLGTAKFDRVSCQGRINVEFQGNKGSRTFGPFRHLTIGKDAVMSAEGLVARYLPLDEVWCFGEESEAEIVVLRDLEPIAA